VQTETSRKSSYALQPSIETCRGLWIRLNDQSIVDPRWPLLLVRIVARHRNAKLKSTEKAIYG